MFLDKITFMKYSILALYCIFSLSSFSQGQWSVVGSRGFTNSVADYSRIAVDKNNSPYIVFKDQANYAKASLMKFDGTNWTYIGSAAFSDSASYVNETVVAFNSANQPYVGFYEAGGSGKGTLMKFNGTNWTPVGSKEFTPAAATYISIAIDNHDTPYMAFRDFSTYHGASVMKFDGSAWVNVGPPGFTGSGPGQGALYVDLKIKDDTLYMAFLDEGQNWKASLMKFNGTDWVYVGNRGFSAGDANNTTLAFDTSGVPYVAYTDGANGGRASVMKFDGSSWMYVGSPGLTPGGAGDVKLAIDKNNTLYLAFTDYEKNRKASLMKFDGNSWEYVGNPGFSASEVMNTSLALDNNGIPYVGYQDSSAVYFYGTVMKYESNVAVKETMETTLSNLNINPNPTTGIVKIVYNANNETNVHLQVTQANGQLVYSRELSNAYGSLVEEIDLTPYKKGVFFIRVKTSKGIEVKKVVMH